MSDKKLQAKVKKEAIAKGDSRKQRGAVDGTVMFPVAPTKVELPKEYASWLADLKTNIAQARLKVILASNTAMILLYWNIEVWPGS